MAKSIDIATAHNIIVSRELGTLGQRFVAGLIDLAIIFAVAYFLLIFFYTWMPQVVYSLALVTMVFYHLLWEVLNRGQSPGKMALKLRVVNLDGQSVSLESYLLRWAFRLVDITSSLSLVGCISIYSSARAQRIGDILAGTAVISLRPSRPVSLETIQKLDHLTGSISYPQVVRYKDADMITVKQMIARFRTHPNTTNEAILSRLSQRIASDLEVPIHDHPVRFLEKILSDYIVLTR